MKSPTFYLKNDTRLTYPVINVSNLNSFFKHFYRKKMVACNACGNQSTRDCMMCNVNFCNNRSCFMDQMHIDRCVYMRALNTLMEAVSRHYSSDVINVGGTTSQQTGGSSESTGYGATTQSTSEATGSSAIESIADHTFVKIGERSSDDTENDTSDIAEDCPLSVNIVQF